MLVVGNHISSADATNELEASCPHFDLAFLFDAAIQQTEWTRGVL